MTLDPWTTGHNLHFGVFVPPAAARQTEVIATAQAADMLGLDSVSIQDHPYQPAYLDTWTLLTHLAAVTERISLFPNVANLPLRPPAVLARSVATLDLLSGGRAELGLGAGAFWDAIVAMGGERRTPKDAVVALEEAVRVIRAVWTPGRTPRIDGDHYQLHGAKPGPFPVHPVGIWLGAYKKRMLQLTGRLADGWLPSLGYASVDELADMNAVIDDAAADADRDPRDVRRLFNINGSFSGEGAQFLQGAPAVWVEQLAGLALDEGMSGFILAVEPGDVRSLQVYAEEVAPAVRDQVEAERLTPGSRPESPITLQQEERRAPGDGDHLVAIHDHLRQELTQLHDLVGQVERGHVDANQARNVINTMTMRQNDWTLGTYCESYCRLVTLHHSLEDHAMYPRLRAADPTLGPALDRMVEEHLDIHGLLEDVDRALVGLVAEPAVGLEHVRTALDVLSNSLLAHLTYEEEQLVDPLNRLGFGI